MTEIDDYNLQLTDSHAVLAAVLAAVSQSNLL